MSRSNITRVLKWVLKARSEDDFRGLHGLFVKDNKITCANGFVIHRATRPPYIAVEDGVYSVYFNEIKGLVVEKAEHTITPDFDKIIEVGQDRIVVAFNAAFMVNALQSLIGVAKPGNMVLLSIDRKKPSEKPLKITATDNLDGNGTNFEVVIMPMLPPKDSLEEVKE